MRRKTILLSLIGFVMVFVIIYVVNFDEFLKNLLKLSPEYFFLLLGIQLASILLASMKWRLVLRHSRVKMRNIIPATFVGYFVNGITPIGMAGGEPVRAYIISKTDNLPLSTTASSVIVDLFLEIAPMFLISGIGIYFIFVKDVVSDIVAIFLALVALALLSLFLISVTLVINKRFSLRLIYALFSFISRIPILREYPRKHIHEIDEIGGRFNKAIRLHMMDNYIIFFGTFLSLLNWFLRFLRTYFIFIAIGCQIGFTTVLIVETAISVISFIPLLPGSLGIWEVTSVALYSKLIYQTVPAPSAAAATIINRFFLYLLPMILGIFAAIYLGLNIKKLVDSEVNNDLNPSSTHN
jgi:uncharacterized protein (TIRG00374 family)